MIVNDFVPKRASVEYSYDVNSDDHCESPVEAYEDICFILERLALEKNKTKETLLIYDPFYCEGNVIKRLGSLGFRNVYNRNEDFYFVKQNNILPKFDCIVTNPPYSASHIEELISFSIRSTAPFFLLLPNYVYTKDYFTNMVLNTKVIANMMFYISPTKRYLYTTPKGRRQQKSGNFTSPFPTFWYCCSFRYTDKLVGLWNDSNVSVNKARLVRDIQMLPIDVSHHSQLKLL